MTPYQELLDEAMLGIVRKVLLKAQIDGMEDDQSFYISFMTDHPDTVLSNHVKAKYPDEITIVLQYQFKELRVFEDKFTVNIAFGGVAETIVVPFSSITAFVDPSANFSLQFKHSYMSKDFEELEIEDLQREFEEIFQQELHLTGKLDSNGKSTDKRKKTGQIIALEQEREKKSLPKASNLKSVGLDRSKMVNKSKEGDSSASSEALEGGDKKKPKKRKTTSSKQIPKAGEVISIDKFRRKNHDS